jgi:hypothetical protein
MNWRVGFSLSLLVLEGCAILYLCLPRGRKRTSGPWLIAAAVLGAILGTAIFAQPDVFSGKRRPLPFDPNDEVAMSVIGGEWIMCANFLVGAGIPFLALAIWVLVRGKVKEVPKVD